VFVNPRFSVVGLHSWLRHARFLMRAAAQPAPFARKLRRARESSPRLFRPYFRLVGRTVPVSREHDTAMGPHYFYGKKMLTCRPDVLFLNKFYKIVKDGKTAKQDNPGSQDAPD